MNITLLCLKLILLFENCIPQNLNNFKIFKTKHKLIVIS